MYDIIAHNATIFSYGRCTAISHRLPAMPKQSQVALKLKKLREEAGLSVRAMADALEMPPSTYASYEDKFKRPFLPMELVSKLVPIFQRREINPERTLELAGIDLPEGSIASPNYAYLSKTKTTRGRSGVVTILGDAIISIEELDVRAGAGGNGALESLPESDGGNLVEKIAPVSLWQLPSETIRPVTRAPAERIKIITIVGDSMVPDFLPGQKVMVDTTDVVPSPPGVFVVWDGLNLVVKKVEYVPFSDPPRVRITSKNPDYSPYERDLSEAYIQGRVIGAWKWV